MGLMCEGYIYVLSNPSMLGILKIGRSAHGARKRAKELQQTGVPTPFVVEFEILVKDAPLIEKTIHAKLNDSRVSLKREFFEIEVSEAVDAVLNEVLVDLNRICCSYEEYEAIDNCKALAYNAGEHPFIVYCALRFINPLEIKRSVNKYWEWVEQKKEVNK